MSDPVSKQPSPQPTQLDELTERVMAGIREHVYEDVDEYALSAQAIRLVIRAALSEARALGEEIARE